MADDVEARVRVAEEELNLLKNQVQQTLLDVREHILDLVENGSAIPRGDRPAEDKTEPAPAAATTGGVTALPATETGAAPLPDLGGGGVMPALDMGGGMADMPALDMGGGVADMPALDMGGGDLGDMPGMDMGGDPGMADMPGMDPGAGMDGGFDMENAPFDSTEQTQPGPVLADAPYDGPEAYADQGPLPETADAGYEHGDAGPAPNATADPGPLPDAPLDTGPALDPPEDAWEESVESAAKPAEEQTSPADAPAIGPPASVAVDASLAKMDLVTLVGVVRWVDQAVQRLGQRRVDALLDVWQMTGRISGPTKEMIQRLCALTHEDPDERVPLRDLVAMMIQMEAVLDVEGSSNSRLLAMLFEDPGDPLAGLGALVPH